MISTADATALATYIAWMREGSRRFREAVDGVSEPELLKPSWLPGWSRAHLISHVTRNAEALTNLVRWASTGIETPMYASDAQRVANIERGAREPLAAMRAALEDGDRRLLEAFATLDDAAWDATVHTAHGRRISARQIPWLRAREVWIHAVDLRTVMALDQFPVDLTDALIADVVRWRSERDDCPHVVLSADDAAREWTMGANRGDLAVVSGPLDRLLAWLLGRSTGDGLRFSGATIALPRWL